MKVKEVASNLYLAYFSNFIIAHLIDRKSVHCSQIIKHFPVNSVSVHFHFISAYGNALNSSYFLVFNLATFSH